MHLLLPCVHNRHIPQLPHETVEGKQQGSVKHLMYKKTVELVFFFFLLYFQFTWAKKLTGKRLAWQQTIVVRTHNMCTDARMQSPLVVDLAFDFPLKSSLCEALEGQS